MVESWMGDGLTICSSEEDDFVHHFGDFLGPSLHEIIRTERMTDVKLPHKMCT